MHYDGRDQPNVLNGALIVIEKNEIPLFYGARKDDDNSGKKVGHRRLKAEAEADTEHAEEDGKH